MLCQDNLHFLLVLHYCMLVSECQCREAGGQQGGLERAGGLVVRELAQAEGQPHPQKPWKSPLMQDLWRVAWPLCRDSLEPYLTDRFRARWPHSVMGARGSDGVKGLPWSHPWPPSPSGP